MNIIVCIKQVPDAKSVRFDKEKGTLIREGVEATINPFDYYALEAGLEIRDQLGGSVTAITMGPPQANEALREAISMGVDKGVLLSDRAFAGADTLATTYTLAKAIHKLGGADIFICGKQAIDGDTAQVGPGLAARLGIPSITCVNKIDALDGGKNFRIMRYCEEGYEVVEVATPFLITTLTTLNTPRVPSLKGMMKAKKADIPSWDAEAISAQPEKIGFPGSPTQVISTYVPQFQAKKEFIEGSPEEQVEILVQRLKEAGIV